MADGEVVDGECEKWRIFRSSRKVLDPYLEGGATRMSSEAHLRRQLGLHIIPRINLHFLTCDLILLWNL